MIKQHSYHFSLSLFICNNLWGSYILLYLEFVNIVSTLHLTFIEFIILLYTFKVISFAWYKEYMIRQILFNNFSDVLPACTRGGATCNLQNICLWVNILCYVAMFQGRPFPFADFNGSIPLSRVTSRSS